jgi:hypothetical protein
MYGRPCKDAELDMQRWYKGQPVLTDPTQFIVGMKITEYTGQAGLSQQGDHLTVTRAPYKKRLNDNSLWIDVSSTRYPFSYTFRSLSDHGIMQDGQTPYNENRFVLGWLGRPNGEKDYLCPTCQRVFRDVYSANECNNKHPQVIETEPIYSKGGVRPYAVKVVFSDGTTRKYEGCY